MSVRCHEELDSKSEVVVLHLVYPLPAEEVAELST